MNVSLLSGSKFHPKYSISKYYNSHISVWKFRNVTTSKNQTYQICKFIKMIVEGIWDPGW